MSSLCATPLTAQVLMCPIALRMTTPISVRHRVVVCRVHTRSAVNANAAIAPGPTTHASSKGSKTSCCVTALSTKGTLRDVTLGAPAIDRAIVLTTPTLANHRGTAVRAAPCSLHRVPHSGPPSPTTPSGGYPHTLHP